MKKVTFTFGRMNPPTSGHQKLVDKLKSVAKGSDVRVYLSHSQNNKKDPLDYNTKYALAMKAFGSIVTKSNAKTIIQVLQDLEKSGYTDITMVVGSDRVAGFKDLLNKYNGKDYNFESINVVSAGQRDPDADDVSGMSASKMRALAKEGNFAEFKQGLPKNVQSQAKKVYDQLRSIMEQPETEEQLDEYTVLTQTQRLKRARLMKRIAKKVARARKIRSKRMADTNRLMKRSRKKAIQALRKRVAGERGKSYADLGRAEKITVDKLVQKKSAVIDRLAKRLLPKVRKAEVARVQAARSTKSESYQPLEERGGNGPNITRVRNEIEREKERNAQKFDRMRDIARVQDVIAKNRQEQVNAHPIPNPRGGVFDDGDYPDIGTTPQEMDKMLKPKNQPKSPKKVDPRIDGPTPGDSTKRMHFAHFMAKGNKLNEVAQDKDIKDREGSQPAKYHSGLEKSTKEKRDAQFQKGAEMDHKDPAAYPEKHAGDDDAKTRTSKHTKKYHDMFGEKKDCKEEFELTEESKAALQKKADKSGIPYSILKKVYDRGMAAWRTGHRPGAGQEQWAYARVNSFITKGKGTWGGADKDLAAKVKSEAVELEEATPTDAVDAISKLPDYVLRTTGLGTTNAKGEKIVYTDKEPKQQKKEEKKYKTEGSWNDRYTMTGDKSNPPAVNKMPKPRTYSQAMAKSKEMAAKNPGSTPLVDYVPNFRGGGEYVGGTTRTLNNGYEPEEIDEGSPWADLKIAFGKKFNKNYEKAIKWMKDNNKDAAAAARMFQGVDARTLASMTEELDIIEAKKQKPFMVFSPSSYKSHQILGKYKTKEEAEKALETFQKHMPKTHKPLEIRMNEELEEGIGAVAKTFANMMSRRSMKGKKVEPVDKPRTDMSDKFTKSKPEDSPVYTKPQVKEEEQIDEIGLGVVTRYLTKRIGQSLTKKPGDVSKKSPETQIGNIANAKKRIDKAYGGKPQLVQSPAPQKPSGTVKSLQTTSSKRPMPASTRNPANEQVEVDEGIGKLLAKGLTTKTGRKIVKNVAKAAVAGSLGYGATKLPPQKPSVDTDTPKTTEVQKKKEVTEGAKEISDKNHKKKMLKDILPKSGAGAWGTDELANNYKNATPGQGVNEETLEENPLAALAARGAAAGLSKLAKSKWWNKGRNERIPNEDKASVKTLAKDDISQMTKSDKAFKSGSNKVTDHRPLKAFSPSMVKTGPSPAIRQAVERPLKAVSRLGEAFEYHIENDLSLKENVYRPHSEEYYNFFCEARRLWTEGAIELNDPFDIMLMESDAGLMGIYEGQEVPLDIPLMEEEEKTPTLNKPKRGGKKKFYVYVKDPSTGNIKKVSFGDTSGLKAKIDDPEARKSFVARHQCSQKNDKTKPGYWACRLPYYAKELGLEGGGSFFW